MRSIAMLKCSAVVLMLLLTACVSSPVYSWRTRTASTTYPSKVTMAAALQHLAKARDGYHAAIDEQLQSETGVSRALIVGSGALLTAAGLKAPHDVLLTGGALTGTVYALGNAELPRARINAYLAGIEALNCAESSVVPIRVVDINALSSSVANLDVKADELESAIRVLRTEFDNTKGKGKGGEAALTSAGDTLKGARTVIGSTKGFLVKNGTAAYELYVQVEKIDQSVTRSVANSTPDLSQVKMLANGIGPNITGIVAKAVTDANNTKAASVGSQSVAQGEDNQNPSFDLARKDVASKQDEVRKLMVKVKGLLPPDFDSINTSTMDRCGVPPVPTPFVANPTELQFFAKKQQTSSVDLSGGTKEYVAEIHELPKGFTITPPGREGAVLKVTLDGTADPAPGQYDLRLHDQTPAGNGVIIKINVSPAEGKPAVASVAKAKAPAVVPETKQILDVKTVQVDGKSFNILTATPKADKSIAVEVCGPLDAGNQAKVLAAIKTKAPVKAPLTLQPGKVCV